MRRGRIEGECHDAPLAVVAREWVGHLPLNLRRICDWFVNKAAIGSRRRLPPKHLDIYMGAPIRLPKPLSGQFPERVLVSPV